MSRDQIFKYKKLQAFALREYNEKKPKKVVVRRINSIKILPKKIIPSINVKKDIDLNPFLIATDFGSEVRIYYMLPDCTMLGAENYTKKDFEKIEKKIKKYTKKILELPQITAEEMFEKTRTPFQDLISRMKNLKFTFKELEDRISREFNSLSQLTGLKGKLKNISLTDKITENKRFGVTVDKHNLHFYVYCLNSPLIEGIIYRECFFALMPRYITSDLTDLCSFGAYFLLSGENKVKWLEKWREFSDFGEIYLSKIAKKDIKKIFRLFGFIKPYLDKNELSESESTFLIDSILRNFMKSNRIIAALFFKYLADEDKNQKEIEDLFRAKQILLQCLDDKKNAENLRISESRFVNLSTDLIKMQLNEFYTQYDEIQNIPIGLNRLFQEYLRENRPLKLELNYPKQIKFDETIDFEIIVHNLSNLSFSDLTIKDSLHTIFRKIEDDEEIVNKIKPNERVNINIKLKPIKSGNLKSKSIKISCQDNFNKLYKLNSKPIKIKIDKI